MEKKTKVIYFTELREIVAAAVEDEEQKNDYLNFIDKQLDGLEKRRLSALRRAEKRKDESDLLTQRLYDFIEPDRDTIVDEFIVAFEDEGITKNKIISRLSKLVREGLLEKTTVKVDGKKRVSYRKPSENEDEDND